MTEPWDECTCCPCPLHPAPAVPDDMAAVVKRLRCPPFGTETSERNLMAVAADALEAQAAELARLRSAVTEIKTAWDWWQADSYDRCASVVADAIDEAIANQPDKEPTHG